MMAMEYGQAPASILGISRIAGLQVQVSEWEWRPLRNLPKATDSWFPTTPHFRFPVESDCQTPSRTDGYNPSMSKISKKQVGIILIGVAFIIGGLLAGFSSRRLSPAERQLVGRWTYRTIDGSDQLRMF